MGETYTRGRRGGTLGDEMSEREDPPSDEDKKRALARAIAELTPEQAANFERLLARAAKRRLILLVGYLLSLVVLLAGALWAFYIYGTSEPGSFRAWVFLVPLAAMGLIFFAAGRLARRFEL
jgi:hypothetical protein